MAEPKYDEGFCCPTCGYLAWEVKDDPLKGKGLEHVCAYCEIEGQLAEANKTIERLKVEESE